MTMIEHALRIQGRLSVQPPEQQMHSQRMIAGLSVTHAVDHVIPAEQFR